MFFIPKVNIRVFWNYSWSVVNLLRDLAPHMSNRLESEKESQSRIKIQSLNNLYRLIVSGCLILYGGDAT